MQQEQTDIHCSMTVQHILSVRSVSREFMEALLAMADEMKQLVLNKGGDDRLKHKAAMLRLGGTVMSVNSEHSSVKKGESLEDTIRCLCSYSDVIAIRHPEKGSACIAAGAAIKPIINAGDGAGEHPTQAFLDAYTIYAELGTIGNDSAANPMVITFCGDLKYSRTIHSLAILLTLYKNVKFIYVNAKGLEMPDNLIEEIAAKGIPQVQGMTLAQAILETDVLYVTRIQKERFVNQDEYEEVRGSYCINKSLMDTAKATMIVMHPLPRVDEIHEEVDSDPRAAYFRQMEYGMYVRMALLNILLLGP